METAASHYIPLASGTFGSSHGNRVRESVSVRSFAGEDLPQSQEADPVEISAEARAAGKTATSARQAGESADSEAASRQQPAEDPTFSPTGELSLEQHLQVMNLKVRDREVRAHEQAHLATAGQYAAGGASFTFQVGPDGNRYAIGGEVPVDISSGTTPEETIRKMDRIRAAALAPAEPSAADRQIAAQASMKAAQARQEILLSRQQEPGLDSATDQADDNQDPAAGPQAAPSAPIGAGGVQIGVMIRTYNQMQDLR